MSEWTYIDQVKLNPEIMGIHCDTRDFYILQVTSLSEKDLEIQCGLDLLQKRYKNIQSHTTFNDCEIIPFLKSLETLTGGKNDWRMISHRKDINIGKYHRYLSYWYKYLRFIKSPSIDKWIFYTTEGDDYHLLTKDIFTKDNLNLDLCSRDII